MTIERVLRVLVLALLGCVVVIGLNSCTDAASALAEEEQDSLGIENDADFVATDWTDATHSKDAEPDFDEVFDDSAVKRIDIVITASRWETMLNNMVRLYGAFGTGQGGAALASTEDPIFVPAEIFYNDKQWYRVGVRFKGNSSLQSSWSAGILKLAFKLDFDEFEDEYPQIDNQRFYGFKKFSLKNNFDDNSLMREKVAGDVFRNAGLAASHTAFYSVYVDVGEGPVYFGLYTLVEEVDDTVIETQFSDDSGNLYKPDEDAATFAEGSYDEDEYVKKTNEDEGDFTDVENLLSIINDGTRNTDPEAWRASLESVFDTDVFLKYLATNTIIQNWDTYGIMTHNYYLYNNPSNSKLTWIPWDNNEALQTGKRGGSLPLNFSSLDRNEWPLIGYMYNDVVYREIYDNYVREIADGPFSEVTIKEQYDRYAALIEPYATTELNGLSFLNSSAEFYSAVSALNTHVTSRASAVNTYLLE